MNIIPLARVEKTLYGNLVPTHKLPLSPYTSKGKPGVLGHIRSPQALRECILYAIPEAYPGICDHLDLATLCKITFGGRTWDNWHLGNFLENIASTDEGMYFVSEAMAADPFVFALAVQSDFEHGSFDERLLPGMQNRILAAETAYSRASPENQALLSHCLAFVRSSGFCLDTKIRNQMGVYLGSHVPWDTPNWEYCSGVGWIKPETLPIAREVSEGELMELSVRVPQSPFFQLLNDQLRLILKIERWIWIRPPHFDSELVRVGIDQGNTLKAYRLGLRFVSEMGL